jgi:hypothetical protein
LKSYLIHPAKLDVNIQVLLVQRLEKRIEQAGQRRRLGLLDDFGTRLFCIVLRRNLCQAEFVDVVLALVLVRRANYEFESVGWDTDGVHCGDD